MKGVMLLEVTGRHNFAGGVPVTIIRFDFKP
jgi:hypothetical protein